MEQEQIKILFENLCKKEEIRKRFCEKYIDTIDKFHRKNYPEDDSDKRPKCDLVISLNYLNGSKIDRIEFGLYYYNEDVLANTMLNIKYDGIKYSTTFYSGHPIVGGNFLNEFLC